MLSRLRQFVPHLLLAALVLAALLPQGFVFSEALGSDKPSLLSSAPAMVGSMLTTTVALAAATVASTLVIGFGAAFLVTRCRLPLRRFWSVALCLPFAIPSYLVAAAAIRASYHPWIPSPEHFLGAVIVLTLTLFPWVYLPAKAALLHQSRQYSDVAQTLGLSPWARWMRIHLWLLLPTLGASALLVFMAVINDFGTTSLLGVRTLSVGIHDARFNMYRSDWAAQLAIVGLILPILVVIAFGLIMARRSSYQPANRAAQAPLIELPLWLRWTAVLSIGAVVLFSVLLPIGVLFSWVVGRIATQRLGDLVGQTWDTLTVTLIVTVLTLLIAFAFHLSVRGRPDMRWWRRAAVFFNLNYAIPSVMIGIALLFMTSNQVASLLLSNSATLLVIGGCLTYLCFPFFTIGAGFSAQPRGVDDLCTVLGITGPRRWWRIDLPLLKRFLAAGALLVIVAMAKDLALSQTLQPFGFKSLSMRLYSSANIGLLEQSAIFALTLVALVAYPVIALDRLISSVARGGDDAPL